MSYWQFCAAVAGYARANSGASKDPTPDDIKAYEEAVANSQVH